MRLYNSAQFFSSLYSWPWTWGDQGRSQKNVRRLKLEEAKIVFQGEQKRAPLARAEICFFCEQNIDENIRLRYR